MLHITNGDAVSARFAEMHLPGEMIPWRDVLHEGPMPAGLSLAELRAVRDSLRAHPMAEPRNPLEWHAHIGDGPDSGCSHQKY